MPSKGYANYNNYVVDMRTESTKIGFDSYLYSCKDKIIIQENEEFVKKQEKKLKQKLDKEKRDKKLSKSFNLKR